MDKFKSLEARITVLEGRQSDFWRETAHSCLLDLKEASRHSLDMEEQLGEKTTELEEEAALLAEKTEALHAAEIAIRSMSETLARKNERIEDLVSWDRVHTDDRIKELLEITNTQQILIDELSCHASNAVTAKEQYDRGL